MNLFTKKFKFTLRMILIFLLRILEGLTNFMYINSYNLETNYYLVLFVKNLKIIHARSSPYLQ